jgi:hypothetical protein
LYACDSAYVDAPQYNLWKYNAWERNVSRAGRFVGFIGLVDGSNWKDYLIETPGINQ